METAAAPTGWEKQLGQKTVKMFGVELNASILRGIDGVLDMVRGGIVTGRNAPVPWQVNGRLIGRSVVALEVFQAGAAARVCSEMLGRGWEAFVNGRHRLALKNFRDGVRRAVPDSMRGAVGQISSALRTWAPGLWTGEIIAIKETLTETRAKLATMEGRRRVKAVLSNNSATAQEYIKHMYGDLRALNGISMDEKVGIVWNAIRQDQLDSAPNAIFGPAAIPIGASMQRSGRRGRQMLRIRTRLFPRTTTPTAEMMSEVTRKMAQME